MITYPISDMYPFYGNRRGFSLVFTVFHPDSQHEKLINVKRLLWPTEVSI